MSNYKQIEGLEPQTMLRRFWDLSEIPRMPGMMQPISDFLAAHIRGLGLEVTQDDHWNVIARKPASPGYENAPVVMLQAHMDMVCEKDPGVEHDFLHDPLALRILEGGKVMATGTTLGADDGLGVAAILAVLEDNTLQHPAIEAVFTADEETDMNGAFALDFSAFKSKYILNLDSDPIQVCGAGELRYLAIVPKQEVDIVADSLFYELSVGGLQGGHTGAQAMLERGNAIVLLNRILLAFDEAEISYQLIDWTGGADMSTAFARNSTALLALSKEAAERASEVVDSCRTVFKEEYKIRDPKITVDFTPSATSHSKGLSDETTGKIKNALLLLPDSVQSLNHEFPGTMESTSNIGIIRVREDDIAIESTIRSTALSRKKFVYKKAQTVCALLGIGCEIAFELPQWDYRVDDHLLELVKEIYHRFPISISQGTLEAGIFVENMPGISFVALAPPYYNPHSPNEYFLIEEAEESYKMLTTLLSRIH